MACEPGTFQDLISVPLSSARLTNEPYMEGPWFRSCGQSNASCKVVKGKVVEVGRWPWHVSILFLGAYICSGSLIHYQWIITAAHCLQRSKDPNQYSVNLGTQELPDNSTRHLLIRIVIHENFDNRISEDIALLKLREPITWSPLIQPVCLPVQNFKPTLGTMCWAVGWGQKGGNGTKNAPYHLQELAMRVVSNDICNHRYQFLLWKNQKKFIGSDMLCLMPEWGLDTCQDTSGSSLLCQLNTTWIQMGVASWSFGCGKRQFPSVYTSISFFTPWIKKHVANMRFTSRAATSFLSPILLLLLVSHVLLVSWGSLGLL
ncbi:PREDICTED: putative serine protease 46 [Dipodomys ordii]|uniref:Serine protease 46 n=1 Tax=Dipodomys ordii TaxID=10020 RepID=A0A1S3GAL9_DIPOR|nr:PREDICTED: putative serine protease 46 [Dipodomys ordii]